MLAVVHVDDAFVVIDKPPGLLSVPGRDPSQPDLATRVRAVWGDADIVHRLDQATSGLVVYARGAAAQRALSQAFAARAVGKRYEAVVEGDVVADAGTIDAPLAADWPRRPRQRVDRQHGRPSTTHWRVVARGGGRTRLALEPVTGRSHQLRVHLQWLGHPVCGDALYGRGDDRAERLLLHACALSLPHPADGRRCDYASAVPF